MVLSTLLVPPFFPPSKHSTTITTSTTTSTTKNHYFLLNPKNLSLPLNNILLSLALAATLASSSPLPSLAIPSLKSQSSPLASSSPTTPFSQSKNLVTGLEDGKIRPCPPTNPGYISTSPKSTSFAFPWTIPESSVDNAIKKLEEAILNTQNNAKIQVVEDTPNGQYLQAEVDGGFGRDVLEFLVKGDVVAYRTMATKVTYLYPFTTALGDSKGQEERMKKIVDQLGWTEGFQVINTILLSIPLSYQPCLMSAYRTISILLYFVYPFAANYVYIIWFWNQSPVPGFFINCNHTDKRNSTKIFKVRNNGMNLIFRETKELTCIW